MGMDRPYIHGYSRPACGYTVYTVVYKTVGDNFIKC